MSIITLFFKERRILDKHGISHVQKEVVTHNQPSSKTFCNTLTAEDVEVREEPNPDHVENIAVLRELLVNHCQIEDPEHKYWDCPHDVNVIVSDTIQGAINELMGDKIDPETGEFDGVNSTLFNQYLGRKFASKLWHNTRP